MIIQNAYKISKSAMKHLFLKYDVLDNYRPT